MANSTDDLVMLINKAVEEKTFTMEGLKAISDIKDKAEKLQQRVSVVEAENERLRTSSTDLKNVIVARDNEIGLLKSREVAIAARETKMFDLEKSHAVAAAVQFAYEKMFDKVFANRQFRESVTENYNRAVPNQSGSYPSMHTETGSRTTTTDEL